MLRVSIGQMNGKSRLQQVQGDVEEVRDIMLDNLNKADERNGKLVELEDRADVLLEMVSGTGITENIFGKSVGRMEKVKGRIHQMAHARPSRDLQLGKVISTSINTQVELERKTYVQFTS